MKIIFINAILAFLSSEVIVFYSCFTHQINFLVFWILICIQVFYFLLINRKIKQIDFIMQRYLNRFNNIYNAVIVKGSNAQNL